MAVCADAYAALKVQSMMAQDKIAHVPSGSADNAYRAWAIAAHEVGRCPPIGMHIRQNLGPVVRQFHEPVISFGEELDIMIRMGRKDGRSTEVLWFSAVEAAFLKCVEKGCRALWALERIDDAPVHHVLLGLVRELRVTEEQLHGKRPTSSCFTFSTTGAYGVL